MPDGSRFIIGFSMSGRRGAVGAQGVAVMKRFALCAVAVVAASVLSVRAQDYKAYQNYDFVPGDKIIFDDDFKADRDGEFPAHWKLISGQGVVNNFHNDPVLALTDGNYAKVTPRMKTESYLTDAYTVEFDMYPTEGGFEKMIVFLANGDDEREVEFGYDVSTSGFDNNLSGTYRGGDGESF